MEAVLTVARSARQQGAASQSRSAQAARHAATGNARAHQPDRQTLPAVPRAEALCRVRAQTGSRLPRSLSPQSLFAKVAKSGLLLRAATGPVPLLATASRLPRGHPAMRLPERAAARPLARAQAGTGRPLLREGKEQSAPHRDPIQPAPLRARAAHARSLHAAIRLRVLTQPALSRSAPIDQTRAAPVLRTVKHGGLSSLAERAAMRVRFPHDRFHLGRAAGLRHSL